MDDALDLLADVEEVFAIVGDALENIEFFYDPGLMSCPIDGCNPDLKFYSKSKWQRHWEEKHVQTSIKYVCSISWCKASCKRRADMRAHIKSRHEKEDFKAVEDILAHCQKTVMENKGFINPGFFVYKGRTKRQTTFALGNPDQEPDDKSANALAIEELAAPIEQSDVRKYKMASEDIPMETGPSSLTISHITERTEASSQTNSLETYMYKSLEIPPPPETTEDIKLYMMWLSNIIDQAGRARELAQQKLERLMSREPTLEEERQKRRELERENRELKRKIKEMEWTSGLFGSED